MAAYTMRGTSLPTSLSIALISITFFLTCFIPLSIYLLLIKHGKVKNLYMEDRSERTTPYIYSILSVAIWGGYMSHIFQFPAFINISVIGAVVALVLMLIVNLRWKISAHLTAMGALIGTVASWQYHTGIYSLWLIPTLLVLALLLSYARIYLNQHTGAQTVAGLLLGLTLTFLPALFV